MKERVTLHFRGGPLDGGSQEATIPLNSHSLRYVHDVEGPNPCEYFGDRDDQNPDCFVMWSDGLILRETLDD